MLLDAIDELQQNLKIRECVAMNLFNGHKIILRIKIEIPPYLNLIDDVLQSFLLEVYELLLMHLSSFHDKWPHETNISTNKSR